MSELSVPTVALPVEVVYADGRSFTGRVFTPASSALHAGPMRLEEWLNEPQAFFPFLPDGSAATILLSKEALVALNLPAAPRELDPETAGRAHEVIVECGAREWRGRMLIDLPPGHDRVLDYINRPVGFVALREGEREHLIHKRHVTRVLETREE